MTQSWSRARIGSEFGLERSYQLLEEGNRIGLGFNLCVAPTCTICSMSYDFGTVIGDQSQMEAGQGSDRDQVRSG